MSAFRRNSNSKRPFSYRREDPYERNYDCFHIRDFSSNDAILVYVNGERERGIVIDVDYEKREIIYRTAYENSKRISMNCILILQERTGDWLKPTNGV